MIIGTDRGIWRRIRLVPWTRRDPAEQRPQEEVVAELVADGSWMLRWMVAGFADWQADHHWVADEVRAATEAYRAEQDRLGGFLAEVCEQKPFAQVSVGELYDAYAIWCERRRRGAPRQDRLRQGAEGTGICAEQGWQTAAASGPVFACVRQLTARIPVPRARPLFRRNRKSCRFLP